MGRDLARASWEPTAGRSPSGRSMEARRIAADGNGELDDRQRRAYIGALEIAFEAKVQAEWQVDVFRLADELIAVSRGAGDSRTCGRSITLVVAVGHWMVTIRAAADRSAHVLAEANARLLPSIAVDAGFFLVQKRLQLGELDEAARVLADVSGLAQRIGDFGRFRGRTRMTPWEIAFLRGPRRAGDRRAAGGSCRAARSPPPDHVPPDHRVLARATGWATCGDRGRGGISRPDSRTLPRRDCPRCRLALEIWRRQRRWSGSAMSTAARRTLDVLGSANAGPDPTSTASTCHGSMA